MNAAWLLDDRWFWPLFGLLLLTYLALKARLARPSRRRQWIPRSVAGAVVETAVTSAAPPVVSLEGPLGRWDLVLATNKRPEELCRALEGLARRTEPAAVEAVGRLLMHPDPRVGSGAADVLGRIGTDRALELLLASAHRLADELAIWPPGGTPPVDSVAMEIASPPGAARDVENPGGGSDLMWPDRARGRLLVERFGPLGPSRTQRASTLVRIATSADIEIADRVFALKNVELIWAQSPPPPSGRKGPSPVDEVGLLLADPSAAVRYAAIGALEVSASNRVADFLEGSLADDHAMVRVRAAMALCTVAPSRARRQLFRMQGDPDEHVRAVAHRLIAGLGAVPPN